MARVLVTGGAGFIGSHLVERLLQRGDSVTVIDNESTGSIQNLAAVREHTRLRYHKAGIEESGLIRQLLDDCDCVYHLAAAVGVGLIAEAPIQTIHTNIHPTDLLIDELCRRKKAGARTKLFLASTSEVYGKNPKPTWTEDDDLVLGPTTKFRWAYGASKAIDEFLALAASRQLGVPVVVGRFFNVVGPRQVGHYGMVLPRFVEAALSGKPLTVHDDGKQTRCFAHVDDVLEAVLGLMESEQSLGEVFNIGSDQSVSILQLAQRVIHLTGSSSPIVFQSYAEAYSAGFEDIRNRVPDLTKIRRTISARPQYNLDSTIQSVIDWMRNKRLAS